MDGINHAINAIKNGNIIIFPTDTVYGIGCDPFNADAIEKIYQIKNRQTNKFLPVLGYSKEVLSEIVEFSEEHEKIISKFWPGPLTIITKITDERIKKSLKLNDKIAVRVPKNDCTLEILKKCKFLIGTSANISGQDSFVDPQKCFEQFQNIPIFVDGGKIISSGASTIIELENNEVKVIREGEISKQEIIEVL